MLDGVPVSSGSIKNFVQITTLQHTRKCAHVFSVLAIVYYINHTNDEYTKMVIQHTICDLV